MTTVQGQGLILGTRNNVLWRGTEHHVSLFLDYNAKVKPTSMTIGYDHPSGTKLYVHFKGLNVAVNLSHVISLESGMDESGDVEDGYYV